MFKEIRMLFTYFLMKLCDLLGDGEVASTIRVLVLCVAGMYGINPRSKIMNECTIHDIKDKISIGKYSFINKGVFFDFAGGIHISKYCNIGCNTIFTNAKPFLKKKKSIINYDPIIVEKFATIGNNCIILSGVTIGARAIIESGSIVISDIPPGALASGRPAKVVKYLYNDNLIKNLK